MTNGSRIRDTMLATFAIQAVGLFTGVLVARLVGVEGRGELAAIVLVPSAIVHLADFGLPVAYVVESARDGSRAAPLLANALVATVVQWIGVAVIGTGIVVLTLHRLGHAVIVSAVIFLLLYLPLNLLPRYINAINQGLGLFRTFNLVRIAAPILYAVLLGGIALFGLGSVTTVLAAAIASNVGALALAVAKLTSAQRTPLNWDAPLFRKTLAFGVRAHVGNLTPVDSMQIDLIVVAALLGARDAGLYSIAVAAALVVKAEALTLGYVAVPAVAAERTAAGQRRAAGGIVRLTVLITVATTAAIVASADVLVPLIYGNRFSGAATLVRILAIGIVFASLRQIVGDCLRGAGYPLASTSAELTSWLVGIPAMILLLPSFGAAGAAIAVSLSYGAALAATIVLASRRGFTFAELFRPRASDLEFAARAVRRSGSGHPPNEHMAVPAAQVTPS